MLNEEIDYSISKAAHFLRRKFQPRLRHIGIVGCFCETPIGV